MDVREGELLRDLGDPNRKSTNSIGLVEFEFDFGSSVFRFDPSGALEEVTIEYEVVELESASIPFKSLAASLKAEDAGVARSGTATFAILAIGCGLHLAATP